MSDDWKPDPRTLTAVCEWLQDGAPAEGKRMLMSEDISLAARRLRNGALADIRPTDPAEVRREALEEAARVAASTAHPKTFEEIFAEGYSEDDAKEDGRILGREEASERIRDLIDSPPADTAVTTEAKREATELALMQAAQLAQFWSRRNGRVAEMSVPASQDLAVEIMGLIDSPPGDTVRVPRETARNLVWRIERMHPYPWQVDHACRECVGDGDIVQPGFQCAYHELKAMIGAAP